MRLWRSCQSDICLGKPLWSQASNAQFYGSVSGKCWITAMIAGSCNIEGSSFYTCSLLETCFLHQQGLGQTDRWRVMLTDNGDVNVEIGTPSQTPTSLSSQPLIPTLLTHLNPSFLPWCPCLFLPWYRNCLSKQHKTKMILLTIPPLLLLLLLFVSHWSSFVNQMPL